MTVWTPNFGEEQPNIEGAVYQALGAASLCWEDMSGAGIFQSDEATRIAEGLLRFLREHNSDAKFWEERWREAADQREQMQVERDAARADAERWQERWEKVAEQRDKARARVVELEQGCSSTPLQLGAAINSIDAIEALIRERDAARAEVAALREQMAGTYQAETFTDTDGYPSIRIIKSAERVGENEWAAYIRRKVLADLREQVLMLEHDATCSFIPQDGPCDCVRGAVLALLGGDSE